MKQFVFGIFLCFLIIFSNAQTTEQITTKEYRGTAEKIEGKVERKIGDVKKVFGK